MPNLTDKPHVSPLVVRVAEAFGVAADRSIPLQRMPRAAVPAAGTITLLAGPSGGGKSTRLRQIVAKAKRRGHTIHDVAGLRLTVEKGIARIAAKAVHRLCREGDLLTCAQQRRGSLDPMRRCVELMRLFHALPVVPAVVTPRIGCGSAPAPASWHQGRRCTRPVHACQDCDPETAPMPYRAPVDDYRFLFDHVVDLAQVTGTDRFAEATDDLTSAILTEAILSFLGAGINPETPSWGNFMAEWRIYFQINPGIVLWPGLVVSVAILSINLLGDAVRDALDPRMAQRGIER